MSALRRIWRSTLDAAILPAGIILSLLIMTDWPWLGVATLGVTVAAYFVVLRLAKARARRLAAARRAEWERSRDQAELAQIMGVVFGDKPA